MNAPEPGPGTLSAGRLTKAERDLVIDTGRHVYGCCSDDCEHHGLPEDAQIRAVERILADRAARPADEGLRAALTEAVNAAIKQSEHLWSRGPEGQPSVAMLDVRWIRDHILAAHPAPSAPEEEADE